MTKFSETPLFLLENYLNNTIPGSIDLPEYSAADNDGAYLHSANHTLIAEDNLIFDFYAKSGESDYQLIKAYVQSDWNNEYNRIILHKLLSTKIVPTDEIKRTVEEPNTYTITASAGEGGSIEPSGEVIVESDTSYSYKRVTYNAIDFDANGYAYTVDQGDGIYLRKDHDFFTWFENQSEYDGYLNPDKPYVYIGNGYQFHETLIKIYYYALKDWIKDALPYNNRTDNLSEFIDLIYDRIYSKIYSMQKNLFNLIDPKEIDPTLIDELYGYYNVNPLASEIDTYKKRLFIDNLINFLKKKGTYSSVYIIWKLLSANTNNELTVYDRWHEAMPTMPMSASPYEYFEDYPYVDYYTGNFYPKKYASVEISAADYTMNTFSLEPINTIHLSDTQEFGKILSTHYKVEFDLNHNPMEDGYVLSKEMAEDLYDKWESTRPVNRVSHYHALISLEGAFVEDPINIYTNPIYDANIKTISAFYAISRVENAYIHLQAQQSTIWNVTHDLNSNNLIIDAYDNKLEKIYPNSIKIISDNYISLNFGYTPINGVVIIASADNINSTDLLLEEWIINHNLESKYIIPQFYDPSFIQAKPANIELLDENRFRVEDFRGMGNVSEINYLHTQDTPSDTWIVNHDFDHNGVLVSIFDKDGYKVIPYSVDLTGYNTCTITFQTAIDGYAAVREVGDINMAPLPSKFNGDWVIKVGNGTDLDEWDFRDEGDIKKVDYIINCDTNNFDSDSNGYHFNFIIPRLKYGYITEIGIFDKGGSMAFYSKIDNLYKHYDMIMDFDYIIKY